jgi:DDB1- and CUL4-associated factor 11
VHTWNDGLNDDEAEPKVGRRVNAKLAHDERLYNESSRSNIHPPSRAFYGRWPDDDEDEDEDEDDEEMDDEHDEEYEVYEDDEEEE